MKEHDEKVFSKLIIFSVVTIGATTYVKIYDGKIHYLLIMLLLLLYLTNIKK
ncbi:hypothetical protein [Alkaliphilus transvaalensis]|uniref:hypothetical protein n=1 Tax=Alkaliphilus transvaalensis TaxID=114628 RepID=UPI0012EC8F34|nr:hypothetical protein [Alkaliphilus transvaalensis]